MPAQVLATKLYIPPPRPKVVLRPRLIEMLNDGLNRKLTLISAPAGFGKTTIASAWVASNGRPAAWLSLDEGDNDPTRFLTYFIAALQTISANIGAGMLALLESPQPPSIESILTSLLNEITSNPVDFTLVLDDYHAIDSKLIDGALTFLLEHLPSQMHLVITTREDPHIPVALLRARGQLIELRGSELRFTPVEAAEFLNQVMDLNLSSDDIDALETRTEGWIAGLQLAAISMQGHQDITNFIKSFTGSHRFVLDYLVEEVLQQQSERIQTFLLRTSILERLCGPLCDAVLLDPSASGQNTLEYLEHANMFIVPLDIERRWYRYHHLFAELLRQRLGQGFAPGEVAKYHLRASIWHEENGDKAEAFHHAIAAGDSCRAAGLAESVWQGMNNSFQSHAWLGWVKKLPEEIIRLRPVLCTQVAQSLTDIGDLETSESRLQDAERCLGNSSDGMVIVDEEQFRILPGVIAMSRANNAQVLGNLADTVKYAELALKLIPEDDLFRRAQATVTLEFTHWASGDLEAARRGMDAWMKSMEKVGNLVFVVASAFALADILVAQGRLREAEKTYRQGLELAAAQCKEAELITAHHYLGLAMLAYEMGNEKTAAELLQKARELGEHTTLVDWPYRWRLAQAKWKESEGDLDAALELLEEARRVYVRNPIPDLRPIQALKARVYLKQGKLTKAQEWVRERSLSVNDDPSYLLEFEHIILARVLIAEYQNDHDESAARQAVQLLELLLKSAEGEKRMGSVLEILLTLTLAHHAQGSISFALASLERALSLAEPEGYVRIFVDEGQPMRLLISDFRSSIEKQSHNGVHSLLGYVDKLLTAFARPAVMPQSSVNNQKPILMDLLSQRELDVLRLIAQGLSNQEISKQLFLALDTIKGHNRNIFGKLHVRRRTEAIVRARELGLL